MTWDAAKTQQPLERCTVHRITYIYGDPCVTVLRDLSFSLHAGERVLLMGPSGSGKSTLLHLIGLLDKPTRGTLVVCGQDVGTLTEQKRTLLRRTHIGMIYQFHHLLPELTAEENVAFPLLLQGQKWRAAVAKAKIMLKKVGLGHRTSHKPMQLSGGEQQRVAVGRALVGNPDLVLADEPTGSLDTQSSALVLDLLWHLAEEKKAALLMATHNDSLVAKADRVLYLKDGALADG